MEEISNLLGDLLKFKHSASLIPKCQCPKCSRAGGKKDDDADISPPEATPTARKIPEGSTVRRRLFADDEPAEPSGNPNTINSVDEIDRMIQEDIKRTAIRWGFGIQREEPITMDALSWMLRDSHGESRRTLEAFEASRREAISPPDATPIARKIPEGSTVRRRLFADDKTTAPSGNPNTINSADDVNRIIQEDRERAARRWGFDVQAEELIPANDALSWMLRDCHEERRKRRVLEDFEANRREAAMNKTNKKLRKILEGSKMSYVASIGSLENRANYLLDGTQDYGAESVLHWNFDFDNKMPAAGAVAWQQIGSHWVGNMPGTFTRLVLYPTETENGVNISTSHEESHEERTKGKSDESALKPTDKIEHLLTENIYAMYGDLKREMKIGKKASLLITARRQYDRDVLNDLMLLQNTNEPHLITKSEAIGMIRAENKNDDDNNSEVDICENNNSTPKKSLSRFWFAKEE